MDRANKAMDERNYAQAKSILQEEVAKNPDDPRVKVLLAQADLGLSGFAIMDFIQSVSREQTPDSDIDLAIMPKCDSGPIKKLQGADIRCVVLRVVEHLPDPDDANFAEARQLLRDAYTDPRKTPQDVNFLSAIVELGSALTRGRKLLERSAWLKDNKGRDVDRQNFTFVVHHLKRFVEELQFGFKRVRYSYRKLRQYVVNLDGKPVVKIGDSELVFSEDLNGPSLLRFAAEVIAQYKESVDEQMNDGLEHVMENLPPGLVHILWHLDDIFLSDFYGRLFGTDFRFHSAITKLIGQALGDREKDPDFDMLELIWKHPPKILAALPGDVKQAWNSEVPDALLSYAHDTQNQWDEFRSLSDEWTAWTNANMTHEGNDALRDYLFTLRSVDPRVQVPPESPDIDQMRKWQASMIAVARDAGMKILEGKVPGIPQFADDQKLWGIDLLGRTLDWFDRNFWTLNQQQEQQSNPPTEPSARSSGT